MGHLTPAGLAKTACENHYFSAACAQLVAHLMKVEIALSPQKSVNNGNRG
jgi:hypothetical protein